MTKHWFSNQDLKVEIWEKRWKLAHLSMNYIWKTIIVLQALRNGTILELKTLEKIKLTDWI
jgi:hypothetical protein